MTSSLNLETAPPSLPAVVTTPRRALLVGAATAYTALFVGLFLTGGQEISDTLTGVQILDKYDQSKTMAEIGAYGLVVTAAVLVVLGACLRATLTHSRRHWSADLAFAGTIAMALALVGWAVTTLAMFHATETGRPDVAQAVNVLDNTNFVPAMLGLVCTMVGVGIVGLVNAALPKWLAIGSIVIGAMAPLGPGGFLPFTLFPIWLIAVAALVKRT